MNQFFDKTEKRLASLILPFRKALIVSSQLFTMGLAYLLAFGLRYDFNIPDRVWDLMCLPLALLVFFRFFALWYFKLFSGFWRYVTLPDVISIVKACLIGSAALLVTLWFWFGHTFGGLPRSIFFLEAFFSIVGMTSMRVIIRLYREKVHDRHKSGGLRTLIICDGDEVMSLTRLVMADQQLPFRITGLAVEAMNSNMGLLSNSPEATFQAGTPIF